MNITTEILISLSGLFSKLTQGYSLQGKHGDYVTVSDPYNGSKTTSGTTKLYPIRTQPTETKRHGGNWTDKLKRKNWKIVSAESFSFFLPTNMWGLISLFSASMTNIMSSAQKCQGWLGVSYDKLQMIRKDGLLSTLYLLTAQTLQPNIRRQKIAKKADSEDSDTDSESSENFQPEEPIWWLVASPLLSSAGKALHQFFTSPTMVLCAAFWTFIVCFFLLTFFCLFGVLAFFACLLTCLFFVFSSVTVVVFLGVFVVGAKMLGANLSETKEIEKCMSNALQKIEKIQFVSDS